MQQPARVMDDLGRLRAPAAPRRSRCWPASPTPAPAARRRAARADGRDRRRPEPVTSMVPIASAGNRPPASTEACSMADTSSRSTGRPAPRRKPGVSASALASVPPEVKTTFRGSAPTAAGDRGPRVLDQPAGLAAFGMDRGRVAAEIPRRSHRLPALRGEAAWSHSSRDRPGQALSTILPYTARAAQRRATAPPPYAQLAIAASAGNRDANALNALARCSRCLLFAPRLMLERGHQFTERRSRIAQRRLIAPYPARFHLRSAR